MVDPPIPADADAESSIVSPEVVAWERLPTAAVDAARLVAALAVASITAPIGYVVWYRLADGATAAFAATMLSTMLLGVWIGGARARRVRYAPLREGLRIRRGLCWWREILIPRSRVQHLDLERGPIERRLGLATLVVHTAGTRMNAVRLAGLDQARARALRDALVDRTGEDDAV